MRSATPDKDIVRVAGPWKPHPEIVFDIVDVKRGAANIEAHVGWYAGKQSSNPGFNDEKPLRNGPAPVSP
jgi:hypothetical protein